MQLLLSLLSFSHLFIFLLLLSILVICVSLFPLQLFFFHLPFSFNLLLLLFFFISILIIVVYLLSYSCLSLCTSATSFFASVSLSSCSFFSNLRHLFILFLFWFVIFSYIYYALPYSLFCLIPIVVVVSFPHHLSVISVISLSFFFHNFCCYYSRLFSSSLTCYVYHLPFVLLFYCYCYYSRLSSSSLSYHLSVIIARSSSQLPQLSLSYLSYLSVTSVISQLLQLSLSYQSQLSLSYIS